MATMNLAQQPTVRTTQTLSSFSVKDFAKRMLPMMLEGSIPFATYMLVKSTMHTSDIVALSAGTIVPAILSLVRFVRSRSLDIMNIIIMISLVISIIVALIGGNPQILLIRESAFGGLFGLVLLASLLCPRPLFFYMMRHFRAGNDSAKVAAFDKRWESSVQRRAFRLITVVWGVGMLAEFLLRVVMVFTLSIPAVLALSAVAFPVIYLAMGAWTFWYMSRQSRLAR